MTKKIVLIALLLLGSIGYSQSLDCSKFKNGKFYNTSFPSSYFVIKDAIMEDIDNDVVLCTWSLYWLSDCEYEVVCTKSMIENITIGEKIVVTITDIKDDCFKFNRKLIGKKFDDGSDTVSFYSCIKKD
ncbi:hypothetical protein GON26_00775 [Flavobacterium sp. GA093]|uniref:Uncharacterized protein n=1 Tax=Flavobacterium hydrocarbonoxydans TaxID=2683249 RepID=A0A6I4NFA1_9FLAO|nr:hypothetical protein [Flavobacterium hydrocarbonoxydans]MWB92888.1 hypothetical protein [Flavobacterium hydrocarbonoxydans]